MANETKPVAPEVDLDELLQLAEDGYGTRRVYESTLQALIAETRVLRAASQPHIGSCAGCFFAEVELLAALKDGAEAGEPAEKLFRRVLDVLRDEAHRPACATKLPQVGVVTREHRVAVLDAVQPGRVHRTSVIEWLETGDDSRCTWMDVRHEDRTVLSAIAQAIADAEARGAAAKPPVGVEVGEALAADIDTVRKSLPVSGKRWATSHDAFDRICEALEKCR